MFIYNPSAKPTGYLLEDLDESDDQPAAHLAPQLPSSHLQENLHILQHRQPVQQPLLGERLNKGGKLEDVAQELTSSFLWHDLSTVFFSFSDKAGLASVHVSARGLQHNTLYWSRAGARLGLWVKSRLMILFYYKNKRWKHDVLLTTEKAHLSPLRRILSLNSTRRLEAE